MDLCVSFKMFLKPIIIISLLCSLTKSQEVAEELPKTMLEHYSEQYRLDQINDFLCQGNQSIDLLTDFFKCHQEWNHTSCREYYACQSESFDPKDLKLMRCNYLYHDFTKAKKHDPYEKMNQCYKTHGNASQCLGRVSGQEGFYKWYIQLSWVNPQILECQEKLLNISDMSKVHELVSAKVNYSQRTEEFCSPTTEVVNQTVHDMDAMKKIFECTMADVPKMKGCMENMTIKRKEEFTSIDLWEMSCAHEADYFLTAWRNAKAVKTMACAISMSEGTRQLRSISRSQKRLKREQKLYVSIPVVMVMTQQVIMYFSLDMM